MANNSLAQLTQQQERMEITYKVGDEDVTLSPEIIRDYLVSGNKNDVSREECTMFLRLCQYQHLNPFLKDAFLIKYGKNNPATLVTSAAVLEKRARRQADFQGFEAGIYVIDRNGNIQTRDGEFYLPGESVIGGWCRVFIKGYEKPMFAAVTMNEYAGSNGNWQKKPATMIRKVAKAHALREAFPEDFRGLYIPEEMGVASPDEQASIPQDMPYQPQSEPMPMPVQDTAIEPEIVQDMPQDMPIDDFAAAMM
jgi:phage recombination protein Bet